MQYTDVSPLRGSVNRTLGCVGLRWSTDDDTDHKLAKRSQDSGPQALETGEWFRVEPFRFIRSTV